MKVRVQANNYDMIHDLDEPYLLNDIGGLVGVHKGKVVLIVSEVDDED